MPPIYRRDHVQLAWEREATERSAPAAINNSFGIVKGGIVLPDLDLAWEPYFGVGVTGRSRSDIYRGPEGFIGSIPEIQVTFEDTRAMLEMCLGVLTRDTAETKAANATITYAATTVTDTGEDFTSAPDAKDGTHAIFAGNSVGYIGTDVGGGITELTVYPTPARTGSTGWNGPIPISGSAGDGYEIRVTESVGTASGDKFIVQAQNHHTMTWAARFRGAGGQSNLTLNYLAGKVNRWTLSAREGEPLKLSLDEVIFQDLDHDAALPSSSVPKFNGSTVAPTASQITEEPLYFSQGTLSLFELTNTFARIRAFSLTVDNQMARHGIAP